MDPIIEAIAHVGAEVGKILDLPKTWGMAAGGGLTRLAMRRNADWRGIDVERELRRLHIPIVNRDFDGDNLYLQVKTRQASWADYVLRRAGVSVTSAPVDPRNAEWAADKGPVPAWDGTAPIRPGGGQARPVEVTVIQRESKRGRVARLVDWLVGGDDK